MRMAPIGVEVELCKVSKVNLKIFGSGEVTLNSGGKRAKANTFRTGEVSVNVDVAMFLEENLVGIISALRKKVAANFS